MLSEAGGARSNPPAQSKHPNFGDALGSLDSYSVNSPPRGIGGRSCVDVNRKRPHPWCVAVPVVAVIGAMRGHVLAPGRLCKLPDLGERNSALRRTRRTLRKRAPRGGRTSVIRDPVGKLASRRVSANIFRSDYIAVIRGGHARTIDSSTEAGSSQTVDPGIDISLLLR